MLQFAVCDPITLNTTLTRLEDGISESKANEEAEKGSPLEPFTASNLTSVVTALCTKLLTHLRFTFNDIVYSRPTACGISRLPRGAFLDVFADPVHPVSKSR
jgi:hypothetical protein